MHSNLGPVLRQFGELSGARTELEQALQIGEATLGPNHPAMNPMHNNLGSVLRQLGDLAAARLTTSGLWKLKAALGPDHRDVATSAATSTISTMYCSTLAVSSVEIPLR
jgi:Flp pilus assembly protein TadD